MRVLLVKLSSLGDVVHAYPAVTDAARALPGIEIDWLVDEAFAPLARMHPSIRRVIPLPIRRMKKQPAATLAEARARVSELRSERYYRLIDAQGLLKSALAGRLARADERHGFARGSARESLAPLFYDRGHSIPETEHMATRIRRLFAASLGYPMPDTAADAGLRPVFANGGFRAKRIVLIHGTSWKTKTWTLEAWRGVAAGLVSRGFEPVLFAHGEVEARRVAAIAEGLPGVRILPPSSLEGLVAELEQAAGVVTVDTGLGHLAAAYGLPTVGLYGPTNPGLTGLMGPNVTELTARRPCAPCEKTQCAIRPDFGEGPPCLADQTPAEVLNALMRMLPKAVASS